MKKNITILLLIFTLSASAQINDVDHQYMEMASKYLDSKDTNTDEVRAQSIPSVIAIAEAFKWLHEMRVYEGIGKLLRSKRCRNESKMYEAIGRDIFEKDLNDLLRSKGIEIEQDNQTQ